MSFQLPEKIDLKSFKVYPSKTIIVWICFLKNPQGLQEKTVTFKKSFMTFKKMTFKDDIKN